MSLKRGQESGFSLIWLILILVAFAVILYLIYTVFISSSRGISNLTPSNMASINQGCELAASTDSKTDWCNKARPIETFNEKNKKITIYGTCEALDKATNPTIKFYKSEDKQTEQTVDPSSRQNLANAFTASYPGVVC